MKSTSDVGVLNVLVIVSDVQYSGLADTTTGSVVRNTGTADCCILIKCIVLLITSIIVVYIIYHKVNNISLTLNIRRFTKYRNR